MSDEVKSSRRVWRTVVCVVLVVYVSSYLALSRLGMRAAVAGNVADPGDGEFILWPTSAPLEGEGEGHAYWTMMPLLYYFYWPLHRLDSEITGAGWMNEPLWRLDGRREGGEERVWGLGAGVWGEQRAVAYWSPGVEWVKDGGGAMRGWIDGEHAGNRGGGAADCAGVRPGARGAGERDSQPFCAAKR